jgi:hypothetical protein
LATVHLRRHQKTSPAATPADVASAQQEAQHEVEQAQLEARKDIRSESKPDGRCGLLCNGCAAVYCELCPLSGP